MKRTIFFQNNLRVGCRGCRSSVPCPQIFHCAFSTNMASPPTWAQKEKKKDQNQKMNIDTLLPSNFQTLFVFPIISFITKRSSSKSLGLFCCHDSTPQFGRDSQPSFDFIDLETLRITGQFYCKMFQICICLMIFHDWIQVRHLYRTVSEVILYSHGMLWSAHNFNSTHYW